MTSSASFSAPSLPRVSPTSMYNNPITTPSEHYMRPPAYNSMPQMHMAQSPSMFMHPFSNGVFNDQNSMYNPNLPVPGTSDFSTSAYFNGAASAPVIGQSQSYGSMNSTHMSSLNSAGFPSNPMFSNGNSYMGFAKQDCPTTNSSTGLRTSYSTPTFIDQPDSQDAAPMDLSNPYSTQFSHPSVSSTGVTPQNSLEDEGGINLSFPSFNWWYAFVRRPSGSNIDDVMNMIRGNILLVYHITSVRMTSLLSTKLFE